ncbi:hypothetical protein [Helicobacter turcicus]|uniref:GP-PDE domain-containing protein n=2 Tax=Helicobacter turcicus TaxID=2867412 RepID=A0ABS7JN81_9HELI|nr:hypothetical protein [Helicobacter turcicus]MBX7490846.1 hypothetical protein [Helicobacter turcicus]
MTIIAHRGLWGGGVKKNSLTALTKAFEFGFGIETDLRDFDSKIVISHDMASKKCESIETLFAYYKEHQLNLNLALNIKSDGLQDELLKLLQKYEIVNYFVFDMSIPDALSYLNKGFNTFTRLSEYEKQPCFYEKACGLWLDEFQEHWIDEKTILTHLKANKKICIVCPCLHKRPYLKEWNTYKTLINKHNLKNKIMLCTDEVLKAKEFFNGN